jgi:hypothetical protein
MPWAAAILTGGTADYGIVRALLGVSATEIPDATVLMEPFLPTAEAIVKAGITNYASLTSGDNQVHLRAGTAELCAALLCEKMQRDDAQSFTIGQFEERGTKVDWRAKAQELLQAAKLSLSAITTRTWTRRTLVAVAGPTRSGANVPEELEQWVEKIVPRFVDWVEEGGEDDDWKNP